MGRELVDELEGQFRRQWGTIRELVAAVPDEQWTAGETEHLAPARLVYHILSGTEVYARSTSYEEFQAGRIFALDWQAAPASALPDRHSTLRHIDEMERAVEQWLEAVADEGLLAEDSGFPWAGSRKLGRAVYLLRHTQNHIGEANAELRRRGLPRGKWR
jgi:hypothetical protein